MIGLDVIITKTGLGKRQHAALITVLNREVMLAQRKNLPKHFETVPETVPGSGGYRYRRRPSKYSEKKQRDFGHKRPNVRTGGLRAAVLSRVHVSANQYRGRLVTRGTNEHPLFAWQKRELERVSLRERKAHLKFQEKEYARRAKLPEYQSVRRNRKKG